METLCPRHRVCLKALPEQTIDKRRVDMLFVYISVPLAVILGVWIFLIAPGKRRDMDSFKSVRYAHRGLHGEKNGVLAAENSMTAFRRAVDAGFGIELDVHASADGVPVVFHDGTLKRVTGAEGRVEDKTAAELAALSLLGTDEGIPTLAEVLKLVGGRVPLLVEIKANGASKRAAELAAEVLAGYTGPYIVESFNPLSLGVFKEKLPEVRRGFLLDKFTAQKKYRTFIHAITQRCLLNFIARPDFISANKNRIGLFPLPLIRFLFRIPCVAWTVTSEEEEQNAYKSGFDGVIFENYTPDGGTKK